MKFTPEQIAKLARITASTKPDEIDCDVWLEQVAVYLDVLHAGKPVPPELAKVVQHVEVCPDCQDELEAMREMLAQMDQGSGDPKSSDQGQ